MCSDKLCVPYLLMHDGNLDLDHVSGNVIGSSIVVCGRVPKNSLAFSPKKMLIHHFT
jgi:hypothetical protein